MKRNAAIAICCLFMMVVQVRPTVACTSFCMDTPDGPLYGTNLDLFFPGDGLVCVNRRGVAKEGYFRGEGGEVAAWVATYGSVTFNLAGRELAWGGMNEAGLAMSSMELKASKSPDPDPRPPLGEGYLVQHVLDTCGTVAEAAAAVAGVRPVEKECFSHFLVADREGNVAGFEYLDGELVVHMGEGAPLKAMANMRYARSCAAYARGGPRWWWSNPGASAQRVAGAVARMKAFDADRDTSAVAYAFDTLTRVVAAPHTRWNIVCDLAAGEIWFRSVRSPAVKHLALADLDLSCEAPPLMLDVNADLGGDVADALQPYDHDVNLEVFHTFCARWGIEVSAEDGRSLVELFESFACAGGS